VSEYVISARRNWQRLLCRCGRDMVSPQYVIACEWSSDGAGRKSADIHRIHEVFRRYGSECDAASLPNACTMHHTRCTHSGPFHVVQWAANLGSGMCSVLCCNCQYLQPNLHLPPPCYSLENHILHKTIKIHTYNAAMVSCTSKGQLSNKHIEQVISGMKMGRYAPRNNLKPM